METRRDLDQCSLDGISQVECKVADSEPLTAGNSLYQVPAFSATLYLLFSFTWFFFFLFCALPSQLSQSFSHCSYSLASSHKGFFCLLKLYLSHSTKESSTDQMSFPFHTDELICIFSLSQIYFSDNFFLAVTFSLWIHTGFVTCNSPSVFALLLSLVSFSVPLKLIAEVSRGPGRHCCCFLILPTVIFLPGKAPHNSSEVSQDPRAEPVLSNESAVGLKEFMQTIKMIFFWSCVGDRSHSFASFFFSTANNKKCRILYRSAQASIIWDEGLESVLLLHRKQKNEAKPRHFR